jgi:hypothetical protein
MKNSELRMKGFPFAILNPSFSILKGAVAKLTGG